MGDVGGGGQGMTVYLVSAVLRALCDDLVVFELCAGVIYLSLSIVLLHNESCEDWSLRVSRDGHSSSPGTFYRQNRESLSSPSSSLTLLVFRHLRCCPLNCLTLTNMKFRVRAPKWCCIL